MSYTILNSREEYHKIKMDEIKDLIVSEMEKLEEQKMTFKDHVEILKLKTKRLQNLLDHPEYGCISWIKELGSVLDEISEYSPNIINESKEEDVRIKTIQTCAKFLQERAEEIRRSINDKHPKEQYLYVIRNSAFWDAGDELRNNIFNSKLNYTIKS